MKNNITHYIITSLAVIIVGMKIYDTAITAHETYKKRIIQEAIASGDLMRTEFINQQCTRLAKR